MAIEIGSINEALKYNPGEAGERARPFVDLGSIELPEAGSKLSVVFAVLPYQARLVGEKNQPKLAIWIEQPVLAIANGKGYRPLAYAADFREVEETYGEEVVGRVIDLVKQQTRRPADLEPVYDQWEGHDDF